MNFKKLFFVFSFAFLAIVLAGCGQAVIEIDSDGSGRVTQTIPDEMGFFSVEEIKEEIERELSSEVDNESGISRLSVDSKDNNIEVSFQFSNISDIDDNAFIVPVSDLVVSNYLNVEELITISSKVDLSDSSDELALIIPRSLLEFDETIFKLPGQIVAHTDNLHIPESNVAEVMSDGDVVIVYEAGSSFSTGLIVVILIAVGGVGAYFYRKNKPVQSEKEGDVSA